MEFLGNILPFLIFILVVISKTKKTAQKTKPAARKNVSQEIRPNVNEQRTKKTVISKDFKNIGEMLRKEINTAIEEMMDGKKVSPHHKRDLHKATSGLADERIVEQYIDDEREKFEKTIETPGIQVKGEIGDIISGNEIGGKDMPIQRDELVRGIILSEILGKPKSIKR
ncbi:hypothetical protein [Geosporobacter ferrireducens]|uniref:Uncharacterized protein n=1 Tax=Geosporobacter ferrireducens TaxID=1424294 RepID=A0A1D8GC81_9FIRM|nr:hypothetical protein [Geosporobacter ferrireducens]AOT68523.1 hypothetical protein Gferi_02290 [Geosporobacter ferrireducens]MTI53987.1 hypothetical protein [Geosporobacter ferrireducens]